MTSVVLLQDCPICLEEMREEDLQHPLQCQHHCGYNFCQDCIESLIVSSKDDYMEASDGNRHVKVFLHCPNCRSNLSATIRDTLLLRKADTVRRLVKKKEQQGKRANHKDDSQEEDTAKIELTESQQRLYDALHTHKVKEAIHAARKLEAEYMGLKQMEKLSASLRSSTSSANEHLRKEMFANSASSVGSFNSMTSVEEWGVEADLVFGVHDSFRMPKEMTGKKGKNSNRNKHESKSNLGTISLSKQESSLSTIRYGEFGDDESFIPSVRVDWTLLAGLEDFLTDEQKEQITSMMTSGDTKQLSAASLELWQVLHEETGIAATPNIRPGIQKRSSVFQLIAESQAAHEKLVKEVGKVALDDDDDDDNEEKKTVDKLDRYVLQQDDRNPSISVASVGNNLQKQIAFQKRFPLPVRMPKTIELAADPTHINYNARRGGGGRPPAHEQWDYNHHMIRLVDYEWDGTVIDAYSKISIGFLGKVYQPSRSAALNNPGVQRILGKGMEGQMEWPGQPRVLILDAGRQAGRQGAVRGDVVTHINGKPIESFISSGSSTNKTKNNNKKKTGIPPRPESSTGFKNDDNAEAPLNPAAEVERALLMMLHKQKRQIQAGRGAVEKIMVTLNAERSVAEALKRRAATIEKS